jgi:dTDP-4-dehydrorhamnose 3,5-epimerase-like enzyme
MTLIKGNSFTDDRGTINFVNDFHFEGIKRFYTITHPDISVVRAWQGHKVESKHFFVAKGKFLVCWVTIDNWENPAKNLKVNKQILSAEEPQVLIVPPGNANGFRALEPDSTILVFSDRGLGDSTGDLFRFESDYWLCE